MRGVKVIMWSSLVCGANLFTPLPRGAPGTAPQLAWRAP